MRGVFVYHCKRGTNISFIYLLIDLSVDQYGIIYYQFCSSIMALTYFGINRLIKIAKTGECNKYLGSAIILRVALSVIAALY